MRPGRGRDGPRADAFRDRETTAGCDAVDVGTELDRRTGDGVRMRVGVDPDGVEECCARAWGAASGDGAGAGVVAGAGCGLGPAARAGVAETTASTAARAPIAPARPYGKVRLLAAIT